MRSRAFVLVVAAGCGSGSDGPDADNSPPLPDAQPLPSIICGRDFIQLDDVPDDADLAIAGMGTDGFAVGWTAGPVSGGRITALRLDTARAPIGAPRQIGEPARFLGGIADTGMVLMMATQVGDQQRALRVERDLSASAVAATEGFALGREPFGGDMSGIARAWIRGAPEGLVMSYIAADGDVRAALTTPTANPVTLVAMDNGPDHAHLAFQETDAGGTFQRCLAADVDFVNPSSPVLGSSGVVGEDCTEVRNSSGPPASDSMLVVYRTSAGELHATYTGAGVGFALPVWPAGRAIRVRFDGTAFWATWIDEATGALHLGRIDVDGGMTDAALPGRVPVGDEAHELVFNRGAVYIAILEDAGLELLQPCAQP
jgi:hypothetical protein